jgi:hypothetical protein
MRIYRYELEVTDRQTLELPMTAQPLSVAPGRAENYHIDLWCLVPEIAPAVAYTVEIYRTGHPVASGADFRVDATELGYVGTVVMSDGLVWHVFVRPARGEQ